MHLLTGMNLLVNLKQLIYPRVSWHSGKLKHPKRHGQILAFYLIQVDRKRQGTWKTWTFELQMKR